MSALSELYKDIAACKRCDLYKCASRAVPGEGAENAEIMFIGEAPGWHEDQQGRPFVGPAGQFLDKLIASIGLKRAGVYITNVVKHRPPENREPLPAEIASCREWLDRQIEYLKPEMIVTLGRYSLAKFFPDKSISKLHGTAQKLGDTVIFAMYHPAAALHQASLRQAIEQDMLKIPGILAQMKSVPETKEEPKQLSMF